MVVLYGNGGEGLKNGEPMSSTMKIVGKSCHWSVIKPVVKDKLQQASVIQYSLLTLLILRWILHYTLYLQRKNYTV